uniref:Chorion peroxidase n=1 Tax=Glossina brevipalpis TaxID=37001 RepID=A0A1A9X3G1_9MUSC
MVDETTPLTSTIPPPMLQSGPFYVLPGVSPRSRRYKMQQFQWCLGITFLMIFIIALVIVFTVSSNYSPNNNMLLMANETNENLDDSKKLSENSIVHESLETIKQPLVDEPDYEWGLKRHKLNDSQSENAVSAGIKALGDRELLEEGLHSTPVHSPAFRHYRSLNSSPEARKLARRGFVENHATSRVAEMFNYTRGSKYGNIGAGPKIVLPDPTLNISCNFNAKYRHASGICNNKRHPRYYGAALVPYRRMVNPDYADGISTPRASFRNGSVLPSARDVSLKIHRASYDTDSNFTVMLAVFGQFLDHDVTATSLSTSQEGESINCCTVPDFKHPECFPVIILPDDPYYSRFNVTCMNFVRSAPAPTGHFGPRQQLNQATSFIDGSMVYGNSDLRQQQLRTMRNGTLRMFETSDGRQLLPISTNFDDGCNRVEMFREGKYCFESGDDRANENLLLTSMHLLWARQHNYLAKGLQNENPTWDDETIFQESRRIIAAQIAHITYNEFLPVLFGRELAAKKGLLPQKDNLDKPDTYDRNVNPTLANDFAAAAFRFAHTLLPGLLNMNRDNSTSEAIELHKMLFNPFSLWQENGIDNALLGACNTSVQRVDRFFSVEVTEKLFEGFPDERKPICGLDLVSLNIQRGRDHGLPAYPVYRKHCKLPPVDTWDQLAKAVDAESLESMKQIYSSPQDIDVYTGALSEPSVDGAIFGPLLIICRNADDIEEIRKYVMEHRKDETNNLIPCSHIPAFNFTPWNTDQQPQLVHANHLSLKSTKVRALKNSPTNRTIKLEI